MKNKILLMMCLATAAALCSPRGASTRVNAVACDVQAYVVDPDPKGLNVRDAPGVSGKVVAVIPLDGDGTTVHLVASSPDGWVQIDRAETVGGEVVFDKKGWVSGKMLATETRGYGTKGVKLRGEGRAGKVVGTVPPEMQVGVAGCAGDRVKVRYKNLVGFLDLEDQCPNPVTLCN